VSYTAADLAAVRATLLKGEVEVHFADRSVRYRSIQELQLLESRILSEIAETGQRPRQFQVTTSKGFNSPRFGACR
jgi:hypothetical protein